MNELDNWVEEKRAAYLYRVVSEVESGTPRESLFRELAGAADEQAAIWANAARNGGARVPESYLPDLRTRIVAALVRRFGPYALRTMLAAMKVRGMVIYAKSMPGHFMSPALQGPEHRHRGVAGGGNLRAAVFGVNDGIISNASLILGVAGAGADNALIVLTGIAGLVAGAFSMAAGEYVSVRSQREMYEYQIGLEREELDQYPEEEAEELALIYAARGVEPAAAKQLADSLLADREHALDTLAREELGLNPDELGSPWGAAMFSFVSFAAGGVVPLLPFLSGVGEASLPVAIVLTATALFGVGATLSLFTGRSAWTGGLRMLAIGAAAGGVTYLVGKLLGVSLT
ncbi:MAG: VIT1/CCC1 transporter family protein [Betaproteobacteria bacterium]|nr:VIT1/CCC1 transporter family protein [Betaproteobacteria bacterium]